MKPDEVPTPRTAAQALAYTLRIDARDQAAPSLAEAIAKAKDRRGNG